jgi:hypothetical protein
VRDPLQHWMHRVIRKAYYVASSREPDGTTLPISKTTSKEKLGRVKRYQTVAWLGGERFPHGSDGVLDEAGFQPVEQSCDGGGLCCRCLAYCCFGFESGPAGDDGGFGGFGGLCCCVGFFCLDQ